MSDKTFVTCPGCSAMYQVTPGAIGRKMKCPKCDTRFTSVEFTPEAHVPAVSIEPAAQVLLEDVPAPSVAPTPARPTPGDTRPRSGYPQDIYIFLMVLSFLVMVAVLCIPVSGEPYVSDRFQSENAIGATANAAEAMLKSGKNYYRPLAVIVILLWMILLTLLNIRGVIIHWLKSQD